MRCWIGWMSVQMLLIYLESSAAKLSKAGICFILVTILSGVWTRLCPPPPIFIPPLIQPNPREKTKDCLCITGQLDQIREFQPLVTVTPSLPPQQSPHPFFPSPLSLWLCPCSHPAPFPMADPSPIQHASRGDVLWEGGARGKRPPWEPFSWRAASRGHNQCNSENYDHNRRQQTQPASQWTLSLSQEQIFITAEDMHVGVI